MKSLFSSFVKQVVVSQQASNKTALFNIIQEKEGNNGQRHTGGKHLHDPGPQMQISQATEQLSSKEIHYRNRTKPKIHAGRMVHIVEV